MSGQFTGMDIQGVRDLATLMNQKAEEIDSLASAVTSKLGGTQWVGNDRNQFESDWQSTGVTNLKNVSQMLRDNATKANNNAAEQESASSK